MGHLDKDIHQKQSAIRYCLLNSNLPFLEVDVSNKRELSDTATVITDVDVLSISIDSSGNLHKSIFDCKTLGRTSPINRAFWVSGLMRYIGCNEAFVVLRKSASEAHRLSAKHIDVNLFSEKQFASYAKSFSMDFELDYCYSSDINSWITQSTIFDKNSGFEKFGVFLNSELPLEEDAVRGLKRLIAALDKGRGEFNPDRAEHKSIFLQSLMMFSLSMARVIHDLKAVIDYDSSKEAFEKILSYYIWGGREAYIRKQKLTQIFQSISEPTSNLNELELRDWKGFVEMSRRLLESPKDVFHCCLPLREMSFRCMVDPDKNKDSYIASIIEKNNRLRQFITLQAKYLVSATGLPKEFHTALTQTFAEIQSSE